MELICIRVLHRAVAVTDKPLRKALRAGMNYSVRVGAENFVVTNVNVAAGTVDLNGVSTQVDLQRIRGNLYHLLLNDEAFSVQIDADKSEVRVGPHTFDVQSEDERSAIIKKMQRTVHSESGLTIIKAPMPGLIVRLEVKPGDLVMKGQGLVVIEAMKMENEIKSPLAGMVTETMVEGRMTVEKDAPLLQIKPST